MTPPSLKSPHLLQDARVYLSGPMDFVADRETEKKFGWRNRIGQVLRALGVVVFDPWFKPEIRGVEGTAARTRRTPPPARVDVRGHEGPVRRGARRCAEAFWPALHIDLRMVDTSDFVIAHCPDQRLQRRHPARDHPRPASSASRSCSSARRSLSRPWTNSAGTWSCQGDAVGARLLAELEQQVPIKPNPAGSPSQWYMPLVGSEHFFDGFGFYLYHDRFGWPRSATRSGGAARPPESRSCRSWPGSTTNCRGSGTATRTTTCRTTTGCCGTCKSSMAAPR